MDNTDAFEILVQCFGLPTDARDQQRLLQRLTILAGGRVDGEVNNESWCNWRYLCESGFHGLPLTNETVVLQLDPNVARRVNAVLLSARAARRRREAGSGETVLVPCAFLDAVHLVHGQWFITPNVSVADANYEGPYSPVRIRDADSGETATNTAQFI
jgi:hypothetical protein